MLQHFFRMCVTASIVIICSACARTIAIYGGKKKFTNATMTTTARPTSGRATINDQYIYARLNFVSFTSLVFDDRQQTEYVIDNVGLLAAAAAAMSARLCGHRCRARTFAHYYAGCISSTYSYTYVNWSVGGGFKK